MAFLEVEYVSKFFPEAGGRQLCVFKDVRLHIEKSEFVTTVGHSGCGKSTLLNIIAGLEKASAGAIILDGKETDTPGLDRMVVFQNFFAAAVDERLRKYPFGGEGGVCRLAGAKNQ